MKEIIKAVEKIAIEISELLKYGDFSITIFSNGFPLPRSILKFHR